MGAMARIRWRRKRSAFAAVALLIVVFAYANNRPGPSAGSPRVLAHRGVAQTFGMTGIDSDTCTAERIDPPTHEFLENTIPSMRAAFDAGADLVELDVHITRDGRLAVFHDWELDCRTEGTGTTRDHTMAELEQLDVGFGYTADGGRTFPFRGKGKGMMPSLDEVLAEFPDRPLLIHVKSDDTAEGEALATRLAALGPERLTRIAVYGGDAPLEVVRRRLPEIRTMSKSIMIGCLGQYEAMGWTGVVPAACANTELHIPEGYAPWLWGWPATFVDRVEAVGSRVVLVAGDGEFSAGFDRPSDMDRIPEGYTGFVWTNRVRDTAPLLRN